MSDPVRVPSRAELFRALKDDALVLAFEQILNAVNNTLPGAADIVQTNLDAHIADTGDAHQASAIGATPGGSRSAITVQGQLGELDTGKLAASLVSTFILTLLDDTTASAARMTLGLGAIATQDPASVNITGGSINATAIGTTSVGAGRFSSLESLGYVKSGATTVALLPSAASFPYARHAVTDATATTFMSVVAGGGTNIVPVFSNGTTWLIG